MSANEMTDAELSAEVAEKVADLFCDMKLYIPDEDCIGAGGHIWKRAKEGSICGVEKRLPHNDFEINLNEFLKWIRVNRPFVCRTCLRGYDAACLALLSARARKD